MILSSKQKKNFIHLPNVGNSSGTTKEIILTPKQQQMEKSLENEQVLGVEGVDMA